MGAQDFSEMPAQRVMPAMTCGPVTVEGGYTALNSMNHFSSLLLVRRQPWARLEVPHLA
jgi:hypothetical protein